MGQSNSRAEAEERELKEANERDVSDHVVRGRDDEDDMDELQREKLAAIKQEIEATINRVGNAKAYQEILKNEAFTYDAEQKKCRDVFCLLVFGIVWLIAGGVAVYGLMSGNPWRVIKGYDFRGEVCGRGDSAGFDYVFYPDIKGELLGDYSSAVCVESCPDSILEPLVCRAPYKWSEFTTSEQIAIRAVATSFAANPSQWTEDHYSNSTACSSFDAAAGTCPNNTCTNGRVMPPCFLSYKTSAGFGRCVPFPGGSSGNSTVPSGNGNETISENLFEQFTSLVMNPSQLIDKVVSNATDNWWILLITLGTSLLLSFLWLLLLRVIGPLIIIFTYVLVVGACAAAIIILWIKAGYIGGDFLTTVDQALSFLPFSLTGTFEDSTLGLVVAIIGTVVAGVIVIIMLALIPRVKFALKVTKEAGNLILDVKRIVFFPILPTFLQLLIVAYFIFIGGFLVSSGTFDCLEGTFKWSSWLKGFLAIHFFICLWSLFYTEAWEELIYASVGARWFFKKGKVDRPILKSLKTASTYHTGSVAFGSFLITVLTIIRIIINYYLKKARRFRDNKALKFLTCCLNCCLKYFDRLLRFINKSAYIQIAMHGKSFCTSAKNAAMLLLRNVLRVVALNVVTEVFMFLGKVYVALTAMAIAAGISLLSGCDCASNIADSFTSNTTSAINATSTCFTCVAGSYQNTSLLLLIFTFILGYYIAGNFFDIYDIQTDTLFQCYCEDSEGAKMDADEHKGREGFGKLIEGEKVNIEKLHRDGF